MLSREFLINRKVCCGLGCVKCPYFPRNKKGSTKIDEFHCEQCEKTNCNTLYEGWFYTSAKLNEYAKDTASSGLLQRKNVCKDCKDKLIKIGLHPRNKNET